MKPQEKLCQICGKVITDTKRTKYCSLDCNQIARRAYTNNWLENNPGYMKTYFKEHKDKYTRAERKKRLLEKGDQANL